VIPGIAPKLQKSKVKSDIRRKFYEQIPQAIQADVRRAEGKPGWGTGALPTDLFPSAPRGGGPTGEAGTQLQGPLTPKYSLKEAALSQKAPARPETGLAKRLQQILTEYLGANFGRAAHPRLFRRPPLSTQFLIFVWYSSGRLAKRI